MGHWDPDQGIAPPAGGNPTLCRSGGWSEVSADGVHEHPLNPSWRIHCHSVGNRVMWGLVSAFISISLNQKQRDSTHKVGSGVGTVRPETDSHKSTRMGTGKGKVGGR